MKNTDEELVQLNARVPEETKRIVRAAAALTGIKMEVLAADAIKLYCGIANSEEVRRRKKVQKALKHMKPADDHTIASLVHSEAMLFEEATCTA